MGQKIIIINGPNLNLLGTREPEIYGNESLEDLRSIVNSHIEKNFPDLSVDFYQSNTEGEIVNKIQESAGLHDSGIEGTLFTKVEEFYDSLPLIAS